MKRLTTIGVLLAFSLLAICASARDEIPVAAPMTTDLAGSSGSVAVSSVFRIRCLNIDRGGTGFLHKSGNIVTAANVVKDCPSEQLIVLQVQGPPIKITNVVANTDLDLALLYPKESIRSPVLSISTNDQITIGSQVSTWGFPVGYTGTAPLLSSGYLSGIDRVKSPSGRLMPRLVVNAAFNSGNSGGPLVEIENNTVIGVVSSKLAPLPQYIESALKALKEQKYGMTFTKTNPDGTKENISQAQVIEQVLQYLRSQIQLVIGHAVLAKDIRAFLKSNCIEP